MNGPVQAQALAGALEFVPQGIALFDDGHRLAFCNARYGDLLDLPADLIVPGTPLAAIVAFLAERGDLGEGAPDAVARQRVEEIVDTPHSRTQRRTRQGQHIEVFTAHLPAGGIVISFHDATDRVQAEAELERVNQNLERRVAERTGALTRVNAELERARAKADAANRDKTRFLAAASHDLLQPLNAARLYTSTLVERTGASPLAELANGIDAALSAVEDIMSALLDISRIDSGAMRPSPTRFEIGDLLRKIEVEFQPLARAKSIQLHVVPNSAPVVTDRQLLARVLQNLVSNAIKYTRPGGRVLVGARLRGGRVRLDVIDTGIGISREQHAVIFTEFTRLEPGARIAGGLGLGLSIVQRLVGVLGLGLELQSVQDKGSRFSVAVPRARMPATLPPAPEAPRPTFYELRGLRILCVDNDHTILDAMGSLLTGWGCEVRLALSLREITRDNILEGWMPDLVLMDYHLDQSSGLDAIQWLRHNIGGHLPAALVTADRSEAVRKLADEREVAVVAKPVKPAALRAVISAIVRSG